MRYGQFSALSRRITEVLSSRMRQRKLRRDWEEVRTQEFWSRRERSESRRFRLLRIRFGIRSFIVNIQGNLGILRNSIASMLIPPAIFGLLFMAITVAIETAVDFYTTLELIPVDPGFSVSTFPAIAVPVIAALLGFYFATVGIVLGNTYNDVSSAVRNLILANGETKFYLSSVGISIGVGLTIILTDNMGILSFGYLVLGVYALLVCFSGWALARLAIGAFDLMNPITLAREPLDRLYRAIRHLDSKGFLLDDAVLRSTALEASYTLNTLAEIIRLTKNRESGDRTELARMLEILLRQTSFYAQKKHRLRPESGWFIREPSYPRWVESDESARDIALKTSTSLQAEYLPVADWLEKRVAELVSVALEACAETNDRDSALRIISAAGHTVHILAECSRLDDAKTFSKIISDCIWNMDIQNETVDALAPQPSFIMTSLLLGWQKAIASWHEEVKRAVETTNWDSQKTEVVQIRGPARVRRIAQDLLRQIHSEHIIEGSRITPNWFLQTTLASEYILSLREFADSIPRTLSYYTDGHTMENISAEAQAITKTGSLQMLSKADLVTETMLGAVEALEALQRGHQTEASPEIEILPERVTNVRASVLIHLGKVMEQLRPEQSKSEPDYFGETLFTLLYHTEQAMLEGNVLIINRVFSSILTASLKLYYHLLSTYKPPTYELRPAIFNPVLDILDLSGLAIIYEELRDDESAKAVRQAWRDWTNSLDNPKDAATYILDILDMASSIPLITSMRLNWERHLADKVAECGYATPTYPPFEEIPAREAPTLIKMLGMTSYRSLSLNPYSIFAGEFIAPLSGEGDQELRIRRGLRRYYDRKDFLTRRDTPPKSSDEEPIGGLEWKPSVPLSAREIQMLRDDFEYRITPYRQNTKTYELSANGVRPHLVDISLALGWHDYWGLEHFVQAVGDLLLTEQEAWIEVVANSREDSDKLFRLFPVAGVRYNSSGALIQELSPSVTLPDWYPGDMTLSDSVELDPSRMVYVPLPEEYPRHLIKRILAELAAIVFPSPDWALERMAGQLPNAPRFDYAEAFRMEKHRVLQIASPIGWAARENYGRQPWEITYYYYLLRELLFLYFVSAMRRNTEIALRRVLDIAGELCGFTASVTAHDIYTPEEVCNFIRKFKSGDLTFATVREIIYQEFSVSSETQGRSI